MVVYSACVSIFVEGWLWDDGCATIEELCYQVYGFRGTVSNHHALWRHMLLECYQLLKATRIRFRIVTDDIHSTCQVFFQC